MRGACRRSISARRRSGWRLGAADGDDRQRDRRRGGPLEVVREASNRSVDLIALVELTPENLRTMDVAGFNGKWGSPVPLVQIDHVLVARKVAALDTEVVEIDGTDHAAVVAELGLT